MPTGCRRRRTAPSRRGDQEDGQDQRAGDQAHGPARQDLVRQVDLVGGLGACRCDRVRGDVRSTARPIAPCAARTRALGAGPALPAGRHGTDGKPRSRTGPARRSCTGSLAGELRERPRLPGARRPPAQRALHRALQLTGASRARSTTARPSAGAASSRRCRRGRCTASTLARPGVGHLGGAGRARAPAARRGEDQRLAQGAAAEHAGQLDQAGRAGQLARAPGSRASRWATTTIRRSEESRPAAPTIVSAARCVPWPSAPRSCGRGRGSRARSSSAPGRPGRCRPAARLARGELGARALERGERARAPRTSRAPTSWPAAACGSCSENAGDHERRAAPGAARRGRSAGRALLVRRSRDPRARRPLRSRFTGCPKLFRGARDGRTLTPHPARRRRAVDPDAALLPAAEGRLRGRAGRRRPRGARRASPSSRSTSSCST